MGITQDMFPDLSVVIASNAGVLVQVGVVIIVLMVGISLIPRIFSKFV